MTDLNCENTDVVICGCGLTGAMLSACVGQMGVRNIVLEKESDITIVPRGIALDEDGIRLLQGIGPYPSIYKEMESVSILQQKNYHTCLLVPLGMHTLKFIGGTDPVLDKKAFMEMNYATVRSPYLDTFPVLTYVLNRQKVVLGT